MEMMIVTVVEELTSILEKSETKKTKRKKNLEEAKPVRKLTKKERQIIELANKTVLPENYHTVWTEKDLKELTDWLCQQTIVAIDTETMGVNPFIDEIVGISFYAPDKGYYIPLKHIDNSDEQIPDKIIGVDYVKCLPKDLVVSYLKPVMENHRIKWVGHNIKFDIHIIRNWLGIYIKPYFDTMIAQALLDENQSKALKNLAPLYLKIEADTFSTLFGNVTFDKVPILINPETRTGNLATYYAVKDTDLTYKLYEFHLNALKRPYLKDLYKLFFEIEMPFLEIVVEAERHGVKLDTNYLENVVAKQLHQELEDLKQRIYHYTGEINLNSPSQLAPVLYEKLKLPRVNPDKPDSTDRKTMNKLKKEHEVIPLLLEYREKTKLAQAFADKLPAVVVNGRVHTSFNTVGTKCVSGDTLLVTGEGIKEIQHVCDNREVDTFTDISLKVYSANGVDTAKYFYYNGVKPAKQLKLGNGLDLICSHVHPLLVLGKNGELEWIKASELKRGDFIATKIGTELYGKELELKYDSSKYVPHYNKREKFNGYRIPTVMTEELALFIGMYVADGSIHRANGGGTVRLTNTSPEVLEKFRELVKSLFNVDSGVDYSKGKSPCAYFSAKFIVDWLEEVIGLTTGAYNKTVPECILRAPKNIQQAFIKGLSLDTSLHRRRNLAITFTTSSESLHRYLRVMLLNMGFYFNCFSQKVKVNNSVAYSLQISGSYIMKYLDEIGFVQSDKARELLNNKGSWMFGEQGIEYKGFIFVPIIEILDTEAELFDLSVPNNESFVGNGIVNHNTGRMSSTSPNLQQIPAKVGNLIRNAFVADEGRLLASIDFSQQELRVLAHVSQDEVLLNIYKEGKDVHSMTAVGMYNRKYNKNITYDEFEYKRNLVNYFQDMDGNLDDDKLNNGEYIEKLFNEKFINTMDVEVIKHDFEEGKKFEKIRKEAKVVNFGRPKELCRSKTPLKTVKATA